MAEPDNVEFGGASSGKVYVEGVVPAGERDVSAPIKIGSRAATDPPNPVEPGDVVDAYLDLQGRQVVYHDRSLPAGTNEIGGVNLVKIAGTAPSTDSGNVDSGVLRVTVATDDANIAAIKTASEASSDALDDIKAAVEGTLDTSLQTAIPAGTNEIGAVNVSKVAGNVIATGAGDTTSGTLRVVVAADDANIASIQMATEDTAGLIASTLVGDATGSLVKTNLRDADGNEIGTAAKPIHVDIGGEIPNAMDLDRVGGSATDVGIGNAGSGTLRVAVATDDVNIAAIKTASEASSDALGDIKAAVEGTLSTSLQTAIPAGTNEIGGVNLVKIAGTAPSTNSGNVDSGVLRVTVATDDVNIAAIKTAADAIETAVDAIETTAGTIATTTSVIESSVDATQATVGAVSDVAVDAGGEGTISAKLRRITAQLADVITALQPVAGYVEDGGDGTTTNDYTDAVTIDMRAHNQLKLLLKNTDAANGLTCKVTCYAKYGGVISVDVSGETALAPGAVGEVMISEKWAQVVVKVKSTVVDTPATYAYEYIQSVM